MTATPAVTGHATAPPCGCDETPTASTPATTSTAADGAAGLPDVWTGVIGVEGTPTGDGRLIDTGALRWDTPIPLRYVPQDVGGHDGAYVVGTIEDITRNQETGNIEAWGTFDLDSDVGREAARHVAGALTNGVSMDLDEMSFENRVAPDLAAPETDETLGALLPDTSETDADGRIVVHRQSASDELQAITNARIRAATIVAVPAFRDAKLTAGTADGVATDNVTVDGSTFNWVDDVGGLPQYIKRIAKHLQRKGRTEGHAIAIAVNAVKKMCATGDLNFPGAQQVNPGSRAEACAAVADWERKKAQAKATAADTDTLADATPDMTEDGLLFPTPELAEEWDQIENADTEAALAWIEEHAKELGPDLTAALMDEVADELPDHDVDDDQVDDRDDDVVALPAAAGTSVWASERISTKPWSNFSKANYSDEQWRNACAIDTGVGDRDSKSRYKLPYKEPSGVINANGVHAAAARFNQTEGPADAKKTAAAKLRGAYKLMGEDVPDVIAKAAASATSLAASGTPRFPIAPPQAWFTNPNLPGPTPLTVTDEGRIFGHAAQWGTCHTAHPDGPNRCTAPPRSGSQYAYFHTGVTRTADGVDVPTGRITMDTAHAGPSLNQAAAAHHYDHTGYVIADVVAGEDEHGIWLSGALRPDTTDEQVRALRAAPLSGDWRTVAGNLELMAVLAVNMPGFPIPRLAGQVTASGKVTALVASGMLPPPEPARAVAAQFTPDDAAYLRRLAARERADEAAAMRTRIDQVRQRETLRRVRKFAAKRTHRVKETI